MYILGTLRKSQLIFKLFARWCFQTGFCGIYNRRISSENVNSKNTSTRNLSYLT